MDELKYKVMHEEVNKSIRNKNDSFVLVTGILDDSTERMFCTTSMFGSKNELVGLMTQLLLTFCQKFSASDMLKIIGEAYENALQIYGEQKNERNRKDIV